MLSIQCGCCELQNHVCCLWCAYRYVECFTPLAASIDGTRSTDDDWCRRRIDAIRLYNRDISLKNMSVYLQEVHYLQDSLVVAGQAIWYCKQLSLLPLTAFRLALPSPSSVFIILTMPLVDCSGWPVQGTDYIGAGACLAQIEMTEAKTCPYRKSEWRRIQW